jgi:hypothetical protein
VIDIDRVASMAGVDLGPPAGRRLAESLCPLGTVPALGPPRRDVVGEVAGVSAVVERELFDGLVAHPELVEFVLEGPLAAAALAGDGGGVVDRLGVHRRFLDGQPVGGPGLVAVGHGRP